MHAIKLISFFFFINSFFFSGEKGYKEGHEYEEGKKGHHGELLLFDVIKIFTETEKCQYS